MFRTIRYSNTIGGEAMFSERVVVDTDATLHPPACANPLGGEAMVQCCDCGRTVARSETRPGAGEPAPWIDAADWRECADRAACDREVGRQENGPRPEPID